MTLGYANPGILYLVDDLAVRRTDGGGIRQTVRQRARVIRTFSGSPEYFYTLLVQVVGVNNLW